jgi:putative addiction module killer protein/probable addiction module antidote protein
LRTKNAQTTDEPDGIYAAVYPKCRANLKGLWPAGYPETLDLNGKKILIDNM